MFTDLIQPATTTMTMRRARVVRLTAPSEDLVRRGAVLLEDALATASFPAADGGRMLVVRRLAVGAIRPDQSPAGLALAVERALRELAAGAVYALDPSAPARPAVYFSDGGEPYALLAARLARGEPTGAWF